MEAAALDSEMVDMLLDQVKRVFALAKPGMLEAVDASQQQQRRHECGSAHLSPLSRPS